MASLVNGLWPRVSLGGLARYGLIGARDWHDRFTPMTGHVRP
jgi:hypothetical protein